ncbi:hypothetical protein CYMTET_53946, partial [Cymbomonas tetramitiformis]
MHHGVSRLLVYPVEQHSASGAASLSDALRQTATYYVRQHVQRAITRAGLGQRLSSIAESVSFDVRASGVEDAGAEALAAALRDINCKLHTLNISYDGVGAAGAEALAAALRDANCKLHTLNID